MRARITIERTNLRILVTCQDVSGRKLAAVSLNLLEAIEARAQLAACVDELSAALDVKLPPPYDPGDR